MDTGSGLQGIWHLVVLLELHLFYLYTPWILLEHVWLMMRKLLRRVVRGSLMVWLMFTRKPSSLMVLLDFTVDSTYLVLALLCIVAFTLECMIL
uniref:Uncharacterized protein MANES_13G144600 n=1 Tax=Rhizophora mucronata TaxID=61149 RepID=A0A2P2JX17_RHIMU